jgi:hypothetical protein
MRARTVAVLLGSMSLLLGGAARADDTIRHPGDHPIYRIEGEPMVIWGWAEFGWAASEGFGLGGRISFPILDNGFIPNINNSVAITTGLNWVHYSGPGCYAYNGECYGGGSADYIFIPVALQWNFFVARQWSVFGEPGIAIYHGFFNNPCDGVPGCHIGYFPPVTSVTPAFYVGGRYHLNNHIALVGRIGYPEVSFGVSFM